MEDGRSGLKRSLAHVNPQQSAVKEVETAFVWGGGRSADFSGHGNLAVRPACRARCTTEPKSSSQELLGNRRDVAIARRDYDACAWSRHPICSKDLRCRNSERFGLKYQDAGRTKRSAGNCVQLDLFCRISLICCLRQKERSSPIWEPVSLRSIPSIPKIRRRGHVLHNLADQRR